MTWAMCRSTRPETISISEMRSISSPKNSTRTAFSWLAAGMISTTSPRTWKVPRSDSKSLRLY